MTSSCGNLYSRIGMAVRIVAWATLLGACGLLLVNRSLRARAFRASIEAYSDQIAKNQDLAVTRVHRHRARQAEIRNLLFNDEAPRGTSNLRDRTRDDARRLLNDDGPFDVRDTTGSRTTEVWTDPVTGDEWEFIFNADRWVAAYITAYAPTIEAFPPPAAPVMIDPASDGFERYRRWLVGFSPWQGLGPSAWLLMVIIWVFARPFRRPLSEFALASAVICTTFLMAHPGFVEFRGWNSIFSNDPLVWAAVMLIASAACVRRSYRSRRGSDELRPTSQPLVEAEAT